MTPTDLLSGDEGENWARANILLDSVEELELVGPHVSQTDLLYRLFHEEKPRVFDPQKAEFGCTCSKDRVMQTLSASDPGELAEMITDSGVITADCQFCGAHHEINPSEIGG